MDLLKVKTILAAIFIVSASGVSAQFNDSTNYYINFASTGIANKTNDRNSFVLNNNFKFSVYKKNISANISQGWVYGMQQKQLTNRDFTSALDFSLFKTLKRFYYWGVGTYEKSFSLKINNRFQTGLGVGYNLVDKKNVLVVLSNGLLYEKSDLYDNIEVPADSEYETLRNSFRLKFRLLVNDMITLDGTGFLQHSLSDRKDYIIRTNTNLSIKLMRWLSFTTSLTYNKLNRTQRENLLLNFGIKLERYF